MCDFNFFKAAYRLESRRAVRSGSCFHMGMITVSMVDSTIPPMKIPSTAMEQLQELGISRDIGGSYEE